MISLQASVKSFAQAVEDSVASVTQFLSLALQSAAHSCSEAGFTPPLPG